MREILLLILLLGEGWGGENAQEIRPMPKATTVTRIENEIESLPTTDQLKLYDWLGRRLVKKTKPAIVCRKGITEKINRIYASESSELDRPLLNAQLASIEKDEW